MNNNDNPREPQAYDPDVLELLDAGGWTRSVFGEYALAFVDYRMGNRKARPSKRAFRMLPTPATRLDNYLDKTI